MSRPNNSSPLLRIGLALAPMALCLPLAWAVNEGLIGLGGGEKDVLLAIPLAAFSLLFALFSLVMWAFHVPTGTTSMFAALISFSVLAVAIPVLIAVIWR